jgi:hypothetical protein
LTFRTRLQSVTMAAYIPERGLGSIVGVSGGDGRQVEVGVTGREGMTGLAIVHGPTEHTNEPELGVRTATTFDRN